jgi:tetratricopeptide (TPR) repeat protein
MTEDTTLFDAPDNFEPERIKFDGGVTVEVHQTLRGGTGVVHLGVVGDDGDALVAVKTLQKRFLVNPAVRGAYQRELAIWARIGAAPFVLPLMDVWHAGGQPYAVSVAAVDAAGRPQTVRAALDQQPKGLAPRKVLEFAICLAIGMQGAAKRVPGLVHGDLKPENLLLLHDVLHVADFGLAKAASIASGSPPAGTTAYLAPEGFAKGAAWTGARDIYAFGCLLHEMLTGAPPFGADADAGLMRERHEQGAPPIPAFLGKDQDLATALAGLSRLCLAKRPDDRPSGFDALSHRLDQITDQFAPGELDSFWRRAEDDPYSGLMDIMTLSRRAAALLDEDQPGEALDLLLAVPEEMRTGELALLTGTALSLSDRDEEALVYFERCIAEAPPAERRDRCLSEKGLSLRRLRRYDEALALYEGMLVSAGPEALKSVTANYAGTLLDAGRPKEALVVIDRLARDNQRDAMIWTLKGQVEQKLKAVDAAIASFERALSQDPELLQARLELVDLVVLHRLDLQSAFTHLDLAFDLGRHSPGLISRLIAAATLLGRADVAGSLMEGLKRLPEDWRDAIEQEAMEFVRTWSKALLAAQPATPPKRLGFLQRVMGAVTNKLSGAPSPLSGTPAERSTTEAEAVLANGQRPPASITQSRQPPQNLVFETALKVSEDSTLPMMGCRAFPLLGMFAADYYDDLRADGFPDRFASTLRQLSLVVLPKVLSEFRSLELCHLPFRFVTCTHCGTVVLTNRPDDQPMLCRICDKRGPVVAATDAAPADLVAACEAAARLERLDLQGQTLFLAIWPPEDDYREAERILSSVGFNHPRSEFVFERMAVTLARQMGLQASPDRTIAGRLVVTGASESYSGTPWPVQRALMALYLKIGTFPSLSMNLAEAQGQFLVEGTLEKIVSSIVETDGPLPTNPDTLGCLIDCYTHLKRLDKAEQCVAFSLQISSANDPRLRAARGRYQLSLGRFEDAIANLGPAIEDDPLNSKLRLSMIDALSRSGRQQQADSELRRARAIGLNLGL